jgi:hypothetical protein
VMQGLRRSWRSTGRASRLTRFVLCFATVLVGLSLISAQPTTDQTQTLRRISASVMQVSRGAASTAHR